MPIITKQFELHVTPEKFLNNCSPQELIELEMLLSSPRFVNKIRDHIADTSGLNDQNDDL